MNKHENTVSWSLIWWLFKLFGVSVTVPWLIYNYFHVVKMKNKKLLLRGKVVLITGASSGLGEAMAQVFYSYGCKVILVSRRKEELERVKAALKSSICDTTTFDPIVLPMDLTKLDEIKTAVNGLLKEHQQIDILINNAGISYRGVAAETSVDVDLRVMQINYFALIALTKAVLPSMIERQSGHVVCISSVQGKIAIPHRSAYNASKHALQAFCDTIRAELAEKSIKVTVINPGYIRTALSLNAVTQSGQTYGVMDRTTEGGYTPEYIAERVARAVMDGNKELMIAPLAPRLAVFLRYFWPSLYFWIMERRAQSSN